MQIHWFDSTTLDKNLKAVIHKTGKLGFSMNAAKKLKLAENKSIIIGYAIDEQLGYAFYLLLNRYEADTGFRISKAGDYYYLNTKHFFDALEIDYSKPVTYDISEIKDKNGVQFKLKRREKTK